MKVYSAYFNPQSSDEKIVLTNSDFGILFSIFPSIILLTKKQYVAALLFFIIGIAISVIQTYSYIIWIALQICYVLFCGWFAGDIYTYILERQGYKLRDIICANSEDDAELIYYSRARVYE